MKSWILKPTGLLLYCIVLEPFNTFVACVEKSRDGREIKGICMMYRQKNNQKLVYKIVLFSKASYN